MSCTNVVNLHKIIPGNKENDVVSIAFFAITDNYFVQNVPDIPLNRANAK